MNDAVRTERKRHERGEDRHDHGEERVAGDGNRAAAAAARGERATYVEMFDKQTLARYFRVSVDTIDRLVKAGKLPAVRIGNQVRFTLDDVDAFVERHRSPEEAA
jgi:excisionase family DNA binding protein